MQGRARAVQGLPGRPPGATEDWNTSLRSWEETVDEEEARSRQSSSEGKCEEGELDLVGVEEEGRGTSVPGLELLALT